MKTTREKIYDYLKQETAKGNRNVDTETVASTIGLQRTNVSAILNQLVNEGVVTKTNTRPVYYSISLAANDNVFDSMIGSHGSLENVVKLAKAAVHYPSNSLNTLILGEVGTGKSFLAQSMFEYAKQSGVIQSNRELKKVNFRHFINNSEALNKVLFGKSVEQHQNVFEAAANSFLFLDNIHLLEGSAFAKISYFIETGKIQYLDGTVSEPMKVTLIISIDSKANADLISTLRMKMPVLLQLPDLKSRPFMERFELINHFITNEAINTKFNIKIEPDVMVGLMLVDISVNIKSIYRHIKLAVANAYLRNYDSHVDTIQIVVSDFDKELSDVFISQRSKVSEIKQQIPSEFDYTYLKEGSKSNNEELWSDFYGYLNKQVEKYQNQGIDKRVIDNMLSEEIERYINKFKLNIKQAEINFNQLSKVVDPNIITIVMDFIKECSEVLNVEYPSSVIYGLCLHLNALVKNKRETKYLNVEKINEVIESYPQEVALSYELARKIEPMMDKPLSEAETVILAMFLVDELDKEDSAYPQVLVAMHGDSGASSIANVIYDLVKVDNIHAYDMSLQTTGEEAYQHLKRLIHEIDQGKGVIVIYDMGSLKTILDKISSETEIPIRIIYMPITLVGIEASRKASMDSDIDRVYHNLLSNTKKELNVTNSEQSAIICLCHTGEGGAVEIANYLKKTYRNDIKIYSLAISDRKKLAKEVLKIKKFYDIKAFVGTYNPKLFGIPFVPVSRVFEANQTELDAMLMYQQPYREVEYEQIINYLHEELDLDKSKLKQALPPTINTLDTIFGLDLDTRIGLFLHIAAVVSRVLNKSPLPVNTKTDWYFSVKKEEVKQVKGAITKLEKVFGIIIPDSEIANIVAIVEREDD